ncbi:P-selectin-like [Lingula anatina]|uniref:P-selectin-like n=1 Tax=Lingula anatina TaxID=7574 RepID=A0A2R2MI88_LINAN|nr:P-selectin-like [Lingula anatina]|eukprot:XP_023929935.1 P-selectin-like [Lingula anatina]
MLVVEQVPRKLYIKLYTKEKCLLMTLYTKKEKALDDVTDIVEDIYVQTPVTPAPTVPTVPTQPPAVVTTRGLNNNVIPTTPPRHCGFNNGGCTQVCNMMSQTVVCSCHTGYRLLMDGRSCVAIRCTDPGTPQHGRRSVNGLEVGGEIQFECLAGYRLTGNNVVRCTADGTWSSENPTCEAIRCTDPGTPQHGRRSVSGLEVDGEVQFECMAGYRLTGNNVVRCTTDGTWSSENPTCEG